MRTLAMGIGLALTIWIDTGLRAQGTSDFQVGSEIRKEACSLLAEYAISVMADRASGLSATDTIKQMEIGAAGQDENLVFVYRTVTDIANAYFDKGVSEKVAEINMLHPCMTQDLLLDRVWLAEWLNVMPMDHHNYEFMRVRYCDETREKILRKRLSIHLAANYKESSE